MEKQEISVIHPIRSRSLIRYLDSRRIPLDLANRYCVEAVLYSKKHRRNLHYVAFLSNNIGFIFKSSWGFTGSRDVGVTTITADGIRCFMPRHEVVLVFSGFMDFLSYLIIMGLEEPKCDVLILNGCSNVEKGMRFMRQHLHVFCYLGLDSRGRKCQKYIEKNLKGCFITDRSDSYGGAQDLNGLLTMNGSVKRAEDAESQEPTGT